ncbi:hypothetical protein [Pseudonocardia acidicola]|uniref:Uncharacterized protein n=1 Tax=Pseudonocardia acidicola TaxID=2724939 RepID=A0ABX1S679_9PSEU|nr:hypothetical protein [Pseudonocardia acidicola]NMH97073.1 hypothetical protein [Pseudonocardia acidicola]
MRHLADELGDRSTYLRTRSYREALEQLGRPVVMHEPTVLGQEPARESY